MPYKDPEKQKKAAREWYYRNKHVVQDRNKSELIKRQQLIRQLKNVPCTDCGQRFPYYCMDFDHIGLEKKEFNIGRLRTAGEKKFLKEVSKCEVVCAICHRIRTQTRLVSLMDKTFAF